jgi:hypothetical protein
MVLISKVKPLWVDGQRTKLFEVAGFADTGFMVQVRLDAGTRRKEDEEEFYWTVQKCRPNKSVKGMTCAGELPDGTSMTSFDWLMSQVFD